ncbi:hypothetical protein THRCLA_11541 [Thraustotheca clavata]|uniref:TIR domain-containing protein n=1 Tax=Thraustotheca clavata TaxID=74557 RepID=A0A1V9Y7F5_9STRA|nr:hypothetical protein THRCLA_11541 [Thraustotheca clavata]
MPTDLLAHIQSFLTSECHLFTGEETRLSHYKEAVLNDRRTKSGVILEPNDTKWTPQDIPASLNLSTLLSDPNNTGMIVQEINNTLTRLNFEPPPSVVDVNGIAIRGLKLDAMFSYAWKQQEPVLQLYQQCRLARFNVWKDVMGYMKGNIYTAMAAAVENAACLVVYFSTAYINSINCRLEFQYASHCQTIDGKCPQYFIECYSTTFSAAPPKVCRDGTMLLAILTQQYHDLIATYKNETTLPQCTRCKVNFHRANPDGCVSMVPIILVDHVLLVDGCTAM